MIKNPERATRGGAVEGTTKSDISHSVGDAIDLGLTSFDAGYDMCLGYANDADLRRGYVTYGVGVGDKRGPGYL